MLLFGKKIVIFSLKNTLMRRWCWWSTEIRFGSGRNFDRNRNFGFGSDKICDFGSGRNFGSKVQKYFLKHKKQSLYIITWFILYQGNFFTVFNAFPVSVSVSVSVQVNFRFRFRFKIWYSSFGSVPVPVEFSVPVDH